MTKTIALTTGDPGGIGPEVTLKALAAEAFPGTRFLVIGDARLLEKTARDFALPLTAEVLDVPTVRLESFEWGRVSGEYGAAALAYVERAVELATRADVDAIVTAPVSKEAVVKSGADFTGHTGFLQEQTGAERVVMMLAGGDLRVSLVTTHIPFRRIPASLTTAGIVSTIQITHEALRNYFHIAAPRIAVLGLNPHAGDGGVFGSEEADIIAPAVTEAHKQGITATGPLVPDVAFLDSARKTYDAVVAMYHDQGLIPLKTLYFDSGVNITLGLPFVRTSPDHGTAFGIAGTNTANPRSMIAAMKTAALMAGA